MKKILYLEGRSGISGDMTVAALLDLGANAEKMEQVLKSLDLHELHWNISRKSSYGLAGCDFDVIPEEHHLHDHEGEHHHHHEHRNLADVYAVIDHGEMSDHARELAKKIFRIVAEAESKAHGKPIEEVHFHEVGALDSIADITAAAVLIDDLKITDCIVTGLSEGTGTVMCAHGELPVPVPAVLNIASAWNIPLRSTAVKGEMVTPTGIAIAAALRTADHLPEKYTVEKIGIGLGKRDFGRPNILRAMLLNESVSQDKIWQIECSIDDASGEMLALAAEKILEAGARDAYFIPCCMKKSRPAYVLTVLADEAKLPQIEELIFRHTTAIGLRKFPVERTCMAREFFDVELPFGKVQIKKCSYNGITRFYPEYSSVAAVVKNSGRSFSEIYSAAQTAAENE